MPNPEDDALRLPAPRLKGPTAEDLWKLDAQVRWLKLHINWQSLRRFAYSRTDDAVIADEAVRDVYHQMVQWSVEDLEGLQHLKAYVQRAVLNRIIDLRASDARTTSLPVDYENTLDNRPTPEKWLETRDELRELLAELPESWREPLVNVGMYGFTIEETAARLTLTHDAVKKRVANAIKYLNIMRGLLPQDSLFRRVKRLLLRERRRDGK